jgi:hypothetical protein
MNYFVSGIIRIILLEASAALVVMERLIDPAAQRLRSRRRLWAFAVAALSLFAFTNYGELRGNHELVHPWEQYHFFLGSKYLREIGYFDLYKATLLADREGAHALAVDRTRDLHTFGLVPVDAALADGDAVRARFSDARWRAFKDDLARLCDWPAPWREVVSDHGNSGSPAWALVALPFVELSGSSPRGQRLLGCIDLVLMLVLGVFLVRCFGAEVAAVGITLWCLTPISFDYLAGSILRWDWLFALGMAACFLKREKPFAAGAFLGYAIVSKLFPICFAVALAAWLIAASLREKRLHRYVLPLASGAVLVAAVFVVASSAVFGLSIWRGYLERIGVAQVEKYYPNQYSLKTVFLQFAETTPHNLLRTLFKPAVIKQSLPAVDIAGHHAGFLATQLVLTALALFAVTRVDLLEAFAAGPFLVLIWLTVNAYYWNMLGLAGLLFAARPRERPLSAALFGIHATWAAYYFYQHLDWRFAEGYFVALLLLGTFFAWAIQAIWKRSPPR